MLRRVDTDGWFGLLIAFGLLGLPIGLGYALGSVGTGLIGGVILIVLWFWIGGKVIRRTER
jgi:hypothetical protein